jgi:nicotinate-nucleotide adenylyltransferase
MKLGVLGGTFDPVHRGHIRMAEEAGRALELDRMLLVPAGRPVSKTNRPVTPAEHRVNMLNLAVKNKPRLSVSTIEVDRPGPTFTIDTITALKKESGAQTEIYFILGWDSLAQLPEWREPARLAALCWLVAVPRPGCQKPDMVALEQKIPGIAKKVIFLEQPNINISATGIREKVARGENIDNLVNKAVAGYIKNHKLYQITGGKP